MGLIKFYGISLLAGDFVPGPSFQQGVCSPVRAQLYAESQIQIYPCAGLRSSLPFSVITINPQNILRSSGASVLTYHSSF